MVYVIVFFFFFFFKFLIGTRNFFFFCLRRVSGLRQYVGVCFQSGKEVWEQRKKFSLGGPKKEGGRNPGGGKKKSTMRCGACVRDGGWNPMQRN